MEKKVLLISYYFPPIGGAGVQRIIKLIKYLPQFDWIPYILTVKNSDYCIKDYTLNEQIGDKKKICYTYAFLLSNILKRLFRHSPEKPRVISNEESFIPRLYRVFFKFLKNLFYTFFYFPDEYMGWIPFGVIKGYFFLKKNDIDLIISSGPPDTVHIIGYFLKKLTGKKLILDFRDLWGAYNYGLNPYNIKLKKKLTDYFEKTIINSSDRIILVSPAWKDLLIQKYPEIEKNKFVIITNGFDKEDFLNITPKKFTKKFTIIHSGNFYEWRKPDSFLNALFHLFNKHQDIRENAEVYFLGIFPEESRYLIHSLNLEKYIHIFEYKPYKESLSYICGADLALVILGNLPAVKDVLPEKLFDYIGAKKPLIAVTGNGALKEFVEEYSLGKTVSNDNINEIERIIYDYYLDIKNKNEIYNPKDCSGFERKVTAEKLSEVLNIAVQ